MERLAFSLSNIHQNNFITAMLQQHHIPPATIIFIFGGSGDLNQRKLSPALYNLFLDGYMPRQFSIVGLGRTPYTDENFRERLLKGIRSFSRRKNDPDSDKNWSGFSQQLHYISMDGEDNSSYNKLSDFVSLKKKRVGCRTQCDLLFGGSPAISARYCHQLR